MKTTMFGFKHRGFTLIELLVVIAIIGILAGMLLPVLARVKNVAKIKVAQTEIQGLATAISQYDAEYSRMPTSKEAAVAASPDITYGTMSFNNVALIGGKKQALPSIQSPGYPADNSEVMAILMDQTNLPPTINPSVGNHARNPQRHSFITPGTAIDNFSHGVGTDMVYRDPWGNPYIITMDLNGDNKCRDALYSMDAVTTGSSGFSSAGGANTRELVGKNVMVWSLGPDGDATNGVSARTKPNLDNVISW